MRRLKVGVVGLGEVAQIVHLPILQALADRYEIAALCDVSPGLLRATGDRYGVAPDRCHADAAKLAAQPDLDAVFVLNSDEYHADTTIAALRHGKHALVEKPMCLTLGEAEAMIAARDAAGLQVVVAYMRRFAPAFLQAVEEVARLPKINYVRVRDIIGWNRLFIEQSSAVLRFDDVPPAAQRDRAERAERLVAEAVGDASQELRGVYRLLCGLSSHDLSAMRELVGVPKRVVAAAQWNGGRFISAIFEHDGFHTTFETGIDQQRRFDAHIEVYGEAKSVRVQYDTPYIRHLPTTLVVQETVGDAFSERVVRPTFKDPYTHELEHFHDVVVGKATPKTTPEDFVEDLRLFREIVRVLQPEPRPAAVV
jgi:predicted dehydrogenase